MADQSNKQNLLYKLGIWIAEAGKEEFYSPGEIFIRAKDDEVFRVPRFLGEGGIPDAENLLKLIDIVSREMVNALKCERVYLVSLGETTRRGLHFRLLPRYESDAGFLYELDPEVNETNDGLALMAKWRKQFLLKNKSSNRKPFCQLCKAHEEAIEKVWEALHKHALSTQD